VILRALVIACLLGSALPAAALPPSFVEEPVASGWDAVLGITFDGAGNLYACEKAGRVWIVHPDGTKHPTPLIDLSEEVGDWGDHGLLGFALDPDFLNNGHIYLLYVVDRHHLLHYGTPAPLGFDPGHADRRFEYSIGRRPGFLDGRPGLWWSINGQLFPDVPMYVVQEGDVVRMHIQNHSRAVHPMHLHGHHAVVLARDGEKATGSPWWIDSLDVASGHSYDIAFVADNPGIWMDHCHNLPHAAQGLVAHLMYAGVTEPYRVGGDKDNQPE